MEETININAKGNILDVLKQMKEGFEASSKSSESFQNNASSSLSKIQRSLSATNIAAFHQNLQNVAQGFNDLNAPGLNFNSSLKDLSALTGLSGSKLDQLGESARASAKEFGGNAAASINSYKMLLGRLGPDIGKSREGLTLMERNVQILSKTMGGDAAGAADALTTGMLQFGVDLSSPKEAAKEMAKMMDVMANSAQAGAAEVPQISAALKVSGVAAKQAKVTFIETNAAIQALAAGGKEGSEAGMALRNVLGKMAGEDVIPKEAADKLKALGVNMNIVSNTSLPFTARLRELKKAQGDATIMAQVFGVENAAAANILLESVDAQDQLAKTIGKTGGAQKQANEVMESSAEKIARMKASIDDAKIAFFQATGGATAYLGPVTEILTTVNSFAPIFSLAKTGVGKFRDVLSQTQGTLKETSKGAKDAGSSVSGFGSVLKGVGWGMAIGAATALASKLWDIASGAEMAKIKTDAYNLATENGDKAGQKVVKEVNQELKAARQKLELQQAQGKLSKEQFDKAINQENALQQTKLQNQIKYLQQERTAANKLSKEKTAQLAQMSTNNPFNAIDRGVLQGETIALTAKQKRIESQLKELYGVSTQIADEQHGAKVSELTDKKGLVSPKGYSPSMKSQADKVMSGAGEVKRIDVRIDNLIKGDIVINSTTIREGLTEIRKQVSEAIIGGVRDFEVAI